MHKMSLIVGATLCGCPGLLLALSTEGRPHRAAATDAGDDSADAGADDRAEPGPDRGTHDLAACRVAEVAELAPQGLVADEIDCCCGCHWFSCTDFP